LHRVNLCFTERKATGIGIIYVQFITLSLTFHLDLDLPKCLFLSSFPNEILCVFLISPVHFSCSICPTVSQLTPHQHSLTNTNHTAPHYAISFIPLPITLPSEQNSPSAIFLAQYFKCSVQWNTNTNTHNRTHLILYNSKYLFTTLTCCIANCVIV
jgi:hypothetical protein